MKKQLCSLCLLFSFSVFANGEKPNGWQFYNFFGTYRSRPISGDCSASFHGKVFIGFKLSKEVVSIHVTPEFSALGDLHQFIRNSYYPPTECYDCDGDAWSKETLEGDDLTYATYHSSGLEPYSGRTWSWGIGIYRMQDQKILLKWDDCTVELFKPAL